MKQGQLVAIDLILGLLFFLLTLGILFLLVAMLSGTRVTTAEGEAELLYSFDNLERTLQSPPYIGREFYENFKVSKSLIDAYATVDGTNSIDTLILGSRGATTTIGLDPEGYDTCLYLTNELNQPIVLGTNLAALGRLETTSCSDAIRAGRSVCEGYRHGIATMRPVLLDYDIPQTNRIVQLNVVACKL